MNADMEFKVIQDKFQMLVADLVRAGLPDDENHIAQQKVMAYALKQFNASNAGVVHPLLWEKFFRRVAGYDRVALAKRINKRFPLRSFAPIPPVQAIAEGTGLTFTAVRRAVQRQFAKRVINNGDEGSEFDIRFYVRKKSCLTN
jgi:hypothetical protein